MDNPEPAGWAAILLGGAVAVSSAGYTLVKLYRYVRSQLREDGQEQDTVAAAREKEQEERELRRKREAATEAWQVVDKQKIVIDGFESKFRELEQKCDAAVAQCEAERAECDKQRAYLQGVLGVVVEWASGKGLKIPPHLLTPPGSGIHRIVPDHPQGTP